jgi:hypothetical protein
VAITERPKASDADRARLLFGVRHLLVKRRRRRRNGGVVVGLAMLLAAGFYGQSIRRHHLSHSGAPQLTWSKLDLPGVGLLRFSAGASYALAVDDPSADAPSVLLERGELCARIAHRESTHQPFEVRTAQLEVRDIGTMFCVAATDQRTEVTVAEGRVWVASLETGVALELGEGGAAHSGEEAFAVRPNLMTAAAPIATSTRHHRRSTAGDCPSRPTLELRRSCYLVASQRGDFGAQNALYSLALLDADRPDARGLARQELRLYQSRYPRGHLGPEVSLTLIKLLAAEGPDSKVADSLPDSALIDEASHFLAAYPDHPKVYEVALLRANALLRSGRHAEAHRGYQALLEMNAPSNIAAAARRGALATLPASGPTE